MQSELHSVRISYRPITNKDINSSHILAEIIISLPTAFLIFSGSKLILNFGVRSIFPALALLFVTVVVTEVLL